MPGFHRPVFVAYLVVTFVLCAPAVTLHAANFKVAPFEADITIPVGHACMGGGIADAREVNDPLFAKGFVLLGAQRPIVVLALDWCQLNNDAHDRWRDVLADAARTSAAHVMLATVHQHDAPICDLRAQQLLDSVGLKNSLCDPEFHEMAVQKTAAALRAALSSARRVTHVGLGQALVEKLASNRRIDQGGTIHWGRGSASRQFDDAPDGEIDPYLKTISLWDEEQPVLAWSCYSVHPMSHYGGGRVSADFPGLARARRSMEMPSVFQIYFTGCAGDTTAGKYNDGKAEERQMLADRLHDAMKRAWAATRRVRLTRVDFRSADLRLPPRDDGDFTLQAMQRILADPKESRWRRNSAALGLSWRERVAANRPILLPCLDVGPAQFLILPAEAFVGYQKLAQQLRPDSFVMTAGFGDGAPGYIPTDACWDDGYADDYCWVAPRTEALISKALASALGPQVPLGTIRQTTLQVVKQELSPDFCWFHPRAAAIPHAGRNGDPSIILTLQKHLRTSDHYSGLFFMRSDDLGTTWTGPTEIASLAWTHQPDGLIRAVCDVTPGWHAPTQRLLVVGAQVLYDTKGDHRLEHPSPTAYATYDPAADRWSGWTQLQLPADRKFHIARNACSQWLVDNDGTILLPIYFAPSGKEPYSVTVVRCRFDGQRLTYLDHGDELRLQPNIARGLVEPSITRFQDRFLLTIRNDEKGYVTQSRDGLHYDPIHPWTFDDGSDLGSYNTQQHWVTHKEALYLAYTRRDLATGHIPRHRAPLYLAQVDPQSLRVIRATERILVPERGVQLGNFGAARMTSSEFWITDAEFHIGTRRHPRGANGSVFAAKVHWLVPDH